MALWRGLLKLLGISKVSTSVNELHIGNFSCKAASQHKKTQKNESKKKQPQVLQKQDIPMSRESALIALQQITDRRKTLRPKTEILLTIGLDFGTSTVKCIVFAQIGDRRREQRIVLLINGKALFPAICWEQNGELFIGEKPPDVDREYRSPKACLRCEILQEEYPDLTYKESGCSPSAICWSILSYCVEKIREQILNRFPSDEYAIDWNKVYWNMGAPLKGLEHKHLRKHFADILWLSVNHGFQWQSQSTPRANLLDIYDETRANNPPPIEKSDASICVGKCFVFPETHVAVNSFIHFGGNLESGLYFVCDVGAGTTDVAFFRYTPILSKPISFPGTSSIFAGGDEIARELSRITGLDLEIANQQLIEGLADKQFEIVSGSLHKLGEKIKEGKNRAFKDAYPTQKNMELWKNDFRGAAVLGGGSRLPGIREYCIAPLPTGVGNDTIKVPEISLRKIMPSDATELHRIAFGLSIPPTQFYDYWRPEELDNSIPTFPKKEDNWGWDNPYKD